MVANLSLYAVRILGLVALATAESVERFRLCC